MYVLYFSGRVTPKKHGEVYSTFGLISASENYITIHEKLFSWTNEMGFNIVEWEPEGDFCVISKSNNDAEFYGTVNIDEVEVV